jgi:hypothetical protein
LPFEATVPEGAVVYTLTDDLQPVAVSGKVPANLPLLVEAEGEITFLGSGNVTYASCPFTDAVLPISTPTGIDYVTSRQRATTVYNLTGQKVGSGKKGLLIVNGKTVLKR